MFVRCTIIAFGVIWNFMYVQSYSGWKERICDRVGALRVLGFRLPGVYVVSCSYGYTDSTLKVPSRPEKNCFPVFNFTCCGLFMVKHSGDCWTGLEFNRLSLHCECGVETLGLIYCCGLQCHFRNILQL